MSFSNTGVFLYSAQMSGKGTVRPQNSHKKQKKAHSGKGSCNHFRTFASFYPDVVACGELSQNPVLDIIHDGYSCYAEHNQPDNDTPIFRKLRLLEPLQQVPVEVSWDSWGVFCAGALLQCGILAEGSGAQDGDGHVHADVHHQCPQVMGDPAHQGPVAPAVPIRKVGSQEGHGAANQQVGNHQVGQVNVLCPSAGHFPEEYPGSQNVPRHSRGKEAGVDDGESYSGSWRWLKT